MTSARKNFDLIVCRILKNAINQLFPSQNCCIIIIIVGYPTKITVNTTVTRISSNFNNV